MAPKVSRFKSKSKTASPGSTDFAARRKIAMEEEKKRKEEEAEQHATLRKEFGVESSDMDDSEKQTTPGSSRRSSFHTDDSGGSPKKRVSFSDPLSEDGEVRAIVTRAAEEVLTRPGFVRQTPDDNTNTDVPVELHVAFEESGKGSNNNNNQKKTRSFTTAADNDRLMISEQESIAFENAKRRSLDRNASIDQQSLNSERENETLAQAKEAFLPPNPPSTTTSSSSNKSNDIDGNSSPTSAFTEGVKSGKETERVEEQAESSTASVDVHFSNKTGRIVSTNSTLLGIDSQKSDHSSVSSTPPIRAPSMMRPADDDNSSDDNDSVSSIPSTTDLARDSNEYETLFPNANKYNTIAGTNPMLARTDDGEKGTRGSTGDLRKSMSANISLYREDSGEVMSDVSDDEDSGYADTSNASNTVNTSFATTNATTNGDTSNGGDNSGDVESTEKAEESSDDKEVRGRGSSSVLSLFGDSKESASNTNTTNTTGSTTSSNRESSTGHSYSPLPRITPSITASNASNNTSSIASNHVNASKSIAASVGFLAAPQGHLGNIENEIETMNYALRAQIQSLSRNITQATKLLVQENQKLSATKFDQVLESLDRRVRVAFDTYDEVARETESKVDAIATTVTSIDKAMMNKRREEEYSHQQFLERVVTVFEEKLEDKMAVINQSTDILHDQFEELKRFHGRTRENDRKEIQTLIEDSHTKHGVRIKEHHDVLVGNHDAFDDEVKSFRKESEDRFNKMESQLSRMVDSVEHFNTNAVQQVSSSQQDLADKFDAFTKKIEMERREDQKQILQLVKESHKIASGLVEKGQENLLFSQSEVADLKKKLFQQEQQNYDLRREYGKLVSKMEGGAVSPSSRPMMSSTVTGDGDSNSESKSSSAYKATPTSASTSASTSNRNTSSAAKSNSKGNAVNQLFLADPDEDRPSNRTIPSNISPYRPDGSIAGPKNVTLPLGRNQPTRGSTSPYLKKESGGNMLGASQKHGTMRF